MADANIIKRVKEIIESDDTRCFVVVSAPGKRYPSDIKVTDLLLACHKELLETGTCKKSFAAVRSRFTDIVTRLELKLDINSVLDFTFDRIEREKSEEFTASRGEYLCGIIIAQFLGIQFIDAEDAIFFNKDGKLDYEKSYNSIAFALNKVGKAVIPGFYGVDDDGRVKTFPRGGSDITGAVVARAVNAVLYENWTDVSYFLACDPNLVENPKPIETLSYKELRELSYMGAKVLHSESIFPIRELNIPIRIKNTFRPEDKGTTIVPTFGYIPGGRTVTGIAGKKNFTAIYLEKSPMNSDKGFIRRVLSIVEAENISVKHIPIGVDTMSLLIENSDLTEFKLSRIIESIKSEVEPENIRVEGNIAFIAVVGNGLASSADIYSKLFKAIAAADINIKMIDFGSGEQNIILGVGNDSFECCIKAVYDEFFGK